ncbi:MAG: hypothetical protein HQK77_20780 [Desulfobacterales bacterium]|nr:hypothetical protein [Desulfobacterales bacterium]
MDTQNLFQQVTDSLQKGDIEQAKSLAKTRDTKPLRDASLHLKWAEVLDELQLYDELILELNWAVRDDLENLPVYRRLAEVLLDHGHTERACRCLDALIKKQPDNSDNYKALGQALEEMGSTGQAWKVYEIGYTKTQDPALLHLKRALEGKKQSPDEEDVAIETETQIVPARHHIVTFTTLFSGREGVYARQWISPTGETGYVPVNEPITLKVAENHILGQHTIGVYPIRLDQTVNFIAFDFDLPKPLIRKTISSQSQWKSAMQILQKSVCQFIDMCSAEEIPIYLEDSGFKGRHAWIFLDTPISAGVAKKCAELLSLKLKLNANEVSLEIFPKQGRVADHGLGNLIKLPLGIHKKTGKRGKFILPDGRIIENQLEYLQQIKKASKKIIYAIIQRNQAKLSVPVKPVQTQDAQKSLTPEKTAIPKWTEAYDVESDHEVQFLLYKCPVLKTIVDKINIDAMLSHEEILTMIHSIGHLTHGPDAVNAFLQRCVSVDPTNFLKSRLKGNPVSCPKIRSRVPEITSKVGCNCKFDLTGHMYPNPIIHVQHMETNTTELVGMSIHSMQFQQALQEYLKLRKQANDIALLLKKYEAQIQSFFSQAGVESVHTPMGELKRLTNEKGDLLLSLAI